MPAKRDTLSPPASVGPAGMSQLQRMPSRESLNAHPLLSSNSPSSSPLNQTQSNNETSSTSGTHRYVPYTPRHRPPTSSATTGTTTQPSVSVSSPQHQQGGATSKLQLQNLKAASQAIGIGSGTVGWAILEKLVDGETGPEWDDIWMVITNAKPTLLLPLEPYSGEIITSEFIRDHVAFCNGPASSTSPLITLSGLRGTISKSTLLFQSTLPITSKPFLTLFEAESRASVLSQLSPLPSSLALDFNTSLPSFALPGSASLPLPPRFHFSKPPLPPRPGTSSSTPNKPTSTSRITNPFASLFGRPPPSPTASNPSSSPSQSLLQTEEVSNKVSLGTEVSAFSIGKRIVKKSIGKDLSKVIRAEIKGGLEGCPAWVVDRVLDFTEPLQPIPKLSKRTEARQASSTSHSSGSRARAPSLSTASQSLEPSILADSFQTFYTTLGDDLRVVTPGSPFAARKKEEKRVVSQERDDASVTGKDNAEDEIERNHNQTNENNTEAGIEEILEQVEKVICSVFYDRAFRPLSGDDTSHDEALANRIAALNMLDLGLEHLGVEIPSDDVKNGIDTVVKACGEVLQQLEDSKYHSPKDKSTLLVAAHKRIVDGLAHLPQLRLKPEDETEELDQKTPRASTFGKQAAQQAINEASNSPSPSPNPEVEAEAPLTASPEATSPSIPLTEQNTDFSSASGLSEPHVFESQLAKGERDTGPESCQIPTEFTGSLQNQSPPLPPRSQSLTRSSHLPSPAPVSGDLLFPLLIFSVVKANPTHLVSHLLYTQRFRSRSVGGEESYCLVNLMAVVEFLEHVDMGALGLGDSERVMSTIDLTPIPLAHGSVDSSTSPTSPLSSRLTRRMNQQVGELAGLAGSANRVITDVVDSSFGVLRGFLTSNPDLLTPHSETQDSAPWNNARPGFGLLRRGSGFSIANVAASLPGAGRSKTPAGSVAGEEGQQLIEVPSRPSSIKEANMEGEETDTTTSSMEGDEESPEIRPMDRGDTRSVRSFSSMMSERDRTDGRERMSLSDRLANVSVLSRFGGGSGDQHGTKASPPSSRPASRPTSWLPPLTTSQSDSATSSGASSPQIRIAPPNRRFLECSEQDLRVGEVGELLREYRRMVQALRVTGAFEDHV